MDKALESMKRLMDFSVYNTETNDKKNTSSIVEHKKIGGDGKCYGIVRENKKYYIKVSEKTINTLKEDFNYIGGISEKDRNAYTGYQDALKSLELKLRSINESLDKTQKDVEKPTTFMTEETMEMNKEISRVREIMFGSSKLLKESNEFKPVLDIKATDADKKAEPFTIKATATLDKIPTSKKNVEPTKAGVPFCDEVDADMKADPSKAAKKFKITGLQLEAVKKALNLNEDYGQPDYDLMAGDDDLGSKGWDLDEEDENIGGEEQPYGMNPYQEDDEPFKAQGSYTVSNSGGYLVQISDDGDSARVKDAFGGENPETSDWLEIEYVEDEDGEFNPVIDPQGYNIPLNQVMRVNNEEIDESYGQPDYDLMGGDDDLGSKGWDLDDEQLHEGLWDNIKAIGGVGKWGADTSKYKAEETTYELDEEKLMEVVLDVFGKVDTFGKQPFTVPGETGGKVPGSTPAKADGTEVEAKFPEKSTEDLKPVVSIEKTNLYMEKLAESILESFKKGKVNEISGALANRASDAAYEKSIRLSNSGDQIGSNIKFKQSNRFGNYINPELRRYAESNGISLRGGGGADGSIFIDMIITPGELTRILVRPDGSYEFNSGTLRNIPDSKQRVVSNIIKKFKQDVTPQSGDVALESKQVKKKV